MREERGHTSGLQLRERPDAHVRANLRISKCTSPRGRTPARNIDLSDLGKRSLARRRCKRLTTCRTRSSIIRKQLAQADCSRACDRCAERAQELAVRAHRATSRRAAAVRPSSDTEPPSRRSEAATRPRRSAVVSRCEAVQVQPKPIGPRARAGRGRDTADRGEAVLVTASLGLASARSGCTRPEHARRHRTPCADVSVELRAHRHRRQRGVLAWHTLRIVLRRASSKARVYRAALGQTVTQRSCRTHRRDWKRARHLVWHHARPLWTHIPRAFSWQSSRPNTLQTPFALGARAQRTV